MHRNKKNKSIKGMKKELHLLGELTIIMGINR